MSDELELFSSVAKLLRQANYPVMSGDSLINVAALVRAYESVVARLNDGSLVITEPPNETA
jgi:hypothetical protein